jgi:putative multiple sugar transport system substrate-binding protein
MPWTKAARWIATTALLVTASGCGAVDQAALVTAAPERGTIGIALPTTKSPRWVGDGDSMVEQFRLLGYKTDLQYAEDDIQKQIASLDKMIQDGDKALVIGAIDGTALKDVLSKAAAAKIPVIAYDRLIRDSADVSYYASFDNYKVGVLQGQALLAGLKSRGSGPFNVELFAGSSDDNNAKFFFDGAMSVLEPAIASGKLVVRSGQTAFAKVTTQRWDGAIAKKRMQGLLSGTYASAEVDAVLSPYDGISRGILEALQEAGYGKGGKTLPVLTGQDAELESVKLIAGGLQSETVYKDTRELAKVAVQMTDSLIAGGTPEVNDTTQYDNGVKVVPAFLLQPVNVDKSNYERVLVDGGYYTAAELAG